MPITSSRFYVTDELTRRKLQDAGINPDAPGVADELYASGYGPDLGEQPDTGAVGNVQAFGQGFAKDIANTALGIADLPLAASRYLAGTKAKIEPYQPSPVQLENPVFSGAGHLAGFVAQLAGPGLLAKAPGAIGQIGRIANLSSLYEKALMAERGATTLEAAEALPAARGLLSFGKRPVQAVALKAVRAGIQQGTLGALQPGDVEERMQNFAESAKFGLALGATEAVGGAPRAVSVLRGAAGGALLPAPFEVPGLGGRGTGAAIGGLMGALSGGYDAGKKLVAAKAEPGPARPVREPSVSTIPGGTVDRLVFDVLQAKPGAPVYDKLASVLTPERFSTLTPEVQAELQSTLGKLPEYGALFRDSAQPKEGAAPAAEVTATPPTISPQTTTSLAASAEPAATRTAPSSSETGRFSTVDETPRVETKAIELWRGTEAQALPTLEAEQPARMSAIERREAARRAYYDDVVQALREDKPVPPEVRAQPGMAAALERAAAERRNLATRPPQDVWEAAQRPDIKAKAEEVLASGGSVDDLSHAINESLSSGDASFTTLIDESKRLKVAKLALDQLETRRVADAARGETTLPGQAGVMVGTGSTPPTPVAMLEATDRFLPSSQDYAASLGPERTAAVTSGTIEPVTDGEIALQLARFSEEPPAPSSEPVPVGRELVVYNNSNGHLRAKVEPFLIPIGRDLKLSTEHTVEPPVIAAARQVIEHPTTAERVLLKRSGTSVETVTEALVGRGFSEQAARVAAQTINADMPLRVIDPPRTVADAATTATRSVEKEVKRVKARSQAPEAASQPVTPSRTRAGSEAAISAPTQKSIERAARSVERSAAKLEDQTARFIKEANRASAKERKQTAERLSKVLARASRESSRDSKKLSTSLEELNTITSTITSIRDEALKPENVGKRKVAASKIGRLSETLSKQQAEVAAIAERINQRRAGVASLGSTDAAVLNTKLDSMQALIENEAAIITDRAVVPAMQQDVALSTVREAIAMLGDEQMGPLRFASLPPTLQALHVAKRLAAYSEPRNRQQEKARYALLDRFFRIKVARGEYKPNEAARASWPVLASVYDSRQTARATEAMSSALARLDSNLTVRHESFGGVRRLDRWVVEDQLTGAVHEFPTPESAAFASDALLKQRETAPDFTPPGVDTQIDTGGNGPAPPPARPVDGERTSSGLPRRLPTRKTGVVEIGSLRRVGGVGFRVFAEIDKQVRSLTGSDLGLSRMFVDGALPAYSAASRDASEAARPMIELAKRLNIGLSEGNPVDRRLFAAARLVDSEIGSLKKESGVDAARAALPDAIARASESAGLSQAERHFLFGNESAPAGTLEAGGVVNSVLPQLYRDLGIGAEEEIGYFPRQELYIQALSSKHGPLVDPLDWNGRSWAREQLRTRGEAGTLVDPSYQHILDELGLAPQGSFVGTLESYMRQGYRIKHLALHVGEIGAAVKTLRDSGIPIGPNATTFIQNTVMSLLGQPSQADVNAAGGRAARRLNMAKRLMQLHDTIAGDDPGVGPVAGAIKQLAQRFAVKGLEGRERGLASMFLRAQRSSIFGFSVMRATRHVATVFTELYPRFDSRDFATGLSEVLTPSKHTEIVERARKSGMIDMDDSLRFEESKVFSRLTDRAEEKLMWMYRGGDTFTRVAAFRMSELATERAAQRYHAVGGGDTGWSGFLQTTGLDTHKALASPSRLAEIRSLVDRGNVADASQLVARTHIDGTIFNYLKPNAPQYNRTWQGRLFGQFGTWPINMVSSMWDMATGPVTHHGAGYKGIVRSAVVAAKYGLAAEAVYSLGAYLGVDTSGWIPFVHALGYEGGPAVSIVEGLLNFYRGDSKVVEQVADDPGSAIGKLLKQNVPFPGSDTLRRLLSQSLGPEYDEARDILGLQQQQQSAADRWKVALGYRPLSAPHSRTVNFLEPLVTPGPVAAQDALYKLSGGALPPGSEEELSRSTFGR